MARKKCFKCNRRRLLKFFYPHPRMADGHLGKCKDCTKVDVSNNYAENRERYAAYYKNREQRPERKQWAAKQQRKSRAANPLQYKARTAVGNAIRDGRLIRQPCEKQPCDKKAQAHHEDYSKPLDVNWLCFGHHREHHGQVTTARER